MGFFAQLPVEYGVLQSAATGEGPAITSICFSAVVALPGNHGAGMGLARGGGGSTELGKSTVAWFKAGHRSPAGKKKEECSFKVQNTQRFWFLFCIYTVFVCTLNKKQVTALVQRLKSFSASPHKIMRTVHLFQKPDIVQRDRDLISVKFIHWQKMKFNNRNLNCTCFCRTICQAQEAPKTEPSDQWYYQERTN